MKPFHLIAALLALAPASASAQSRGLRLPVPPPPPIGVFNGFPGVWVVEREVPVIVEKEVVREVPVPVVPESPPVPRKPYVVGASYSSLPAGCMKLIEEGASYYYCGGGEWYRQSGKLYRAVEHKL
jgi:hypothetical protein